MAASVRIEDEAFSDSRYAVLAQLCGLADADHARGKMALLWRQCTIEQRYDLHPLQVQAVLVGQRPSDDQVTSRSPAGPLGPAAIVEAGLGELLDNGRIRIKGTAGRIEWLSNLRDGNSTGGKSRAKTAKRDAKGRMVKADGPGNAAPGQSSRGPGDALPGHSSAPAPAPAPVITHTVGLGVDAVKQRLGVSMLREDVELALSRASPFTEAEYQAAVAETQRRIGTAEPSYVAKVLAGIREKRETPKADAKRASDFVPEYLRNPPPRRLKGKPGETAA